MQQLPVNPLPFLLEIGVEEIPHWMIEPALAALKNLFKEFCEQDGVVITSSDVSVDGTPRRLVLRAEVAEKQLDVEAITSGPSAEIAFKDGQPTAAALGFARKCGVEVSQLTRVQGSRGELLAYKRTVPGRFNRDIFAETLPELIAEIPWPKAMYWTGKGGLTFIRPIRWIVALLGDQIVEFEVAGVRSRALSAGHRRLGSDEIAFEHANYEERLEKNGVILSAAKRKERIQKGIKKLLRGTGLKLVADEALLNDLVYLTEYPTPLLGEFREEFLELPAEVLSTVMRHHQRYFTLTDGEGKMAPRFIAVMNMKADRKGYVRKGNERVLEARFNDARFFWQVDRQRPLAARAPELAKVTYQVKLNSTYADKAKGIHASAARLASWLKLDHESLGRAALLCKADLTTEMVKELTELQGVMGGLYAKADGEPETVWRAIYEHYLPQSMEDAIPATVYGQALSIADKLDTLEGSFGIGLIPSGSKDPLGLRRAAQGVVKTLVEGRLRVDLKAAVEAGMQANAVLYPGTPGDPDRKAQLWEFFVDRIRSYFRDVRGYAYDEVNAVLAAEFTELVDVEARLQALKLVRQTENFEPLAASFKRIRNILRQAHWESGAVDASLLEAGAERDLYEAMARVLARVAELRRGDDYIRTLTAIATLRPAVDAFFDKVLVNAPEAAVRANRLALLGRLNREVSSIADFSEIVTSSSE